MATVVYDESISGDLSNTPTTLITLGLGTNTILGSSILAVGGFRDRDSFFFTLLPGMAATSGTYTVLSDSFAGNTTQLKTNFDLLDWNSVLLTSANVNLLLGSESISGLLGAGTYGVNNSSMTRTGGGGAWDYAITIEVSAVPEPSALALSALALSGLFAARKRKLP